MLKITPLDVNWLGHPRSIAACLIESDGQAALIDPGPTSSLPTLREKASHARPFPHRPQRDSPHPHSPGPCCELERHLPAEETAHYLFNGGLELSWLGLARYWRKRTSAA